MRNSSLLIILLSLPAAAAPYFRLIDPSHPRPIMGAMIDPRDAGNSSGATLLPLVTHSPNDGCLLPQIVCEEWTPLAVGVSANAGKITLDIAPLANILPWMVALEEAALPSGYYGPLAWLKPSSGQSVIFSAGPAWEYSQLQNKGYLRIFTGLELNF